MTGCSPHFRVSVSVSTFLVLVSPSPVTTASLLSLLLMRSTDSQWMFSSARLAEERPLHQPASALTLQRVPMERPNRAAKSRAWRMDVSWDPIGGVYP